MEITKTKKEKLKKLLYAISNSEEKNKLQGIDEKLAMQEKMKLIEESINDLTNSDNDKAITNALLAILQSLESSKGSVPKLTTHILESFKQYTEDLNKKLSELSGTFSTSFEKNKPVNMSGVYKDMINQLSEVNQSIKNKPVPVWNWPQYASVGIRNKSFSNVDPANSYQKGSTTETLPWGTVPAFDNAGTIATVSASVGLPVNVIAGTLSITSPGISGLQVNITKVTTSSFAGIRVFQENSPAVTISSPSISGLKVTLADGSNNKITSTSNALDVNLKTSSITVNTNISAASTSVLAGLRVFQENVPVSQAVTLSSTTLAGLTVNNKQINGAAISTVAAGVQKVGVADSAGTAITSTGSALDMNLKTSSITLNTAITAATTSVLSGVRVFQQNSISIASTTLAGLTVNHKQINGVAVVTASAGVQKVGVADGSGTAVTSTGAALDVNLKTSSITVNTSITGATTSVLAGIRVFQENTPSGTQAVSLASTTLAGLKVDLADGSNNKITSTSNALDVNLKTSSITVNTAIASATTSVLAGLKTFVENFPASQTVALASTSISGLKVNQIQINGGAISTVATGVQKVGVADSAGTAITSTGSALDMNLKTSSITLNTSIAGATTSVLAGIRVFQENTPSGTQTVTIASTVLAGLTVNNKQINGIAVSVNSGTLDAGTQRVTIATNQANVPVNIAAATTSVLAGIKVQLENTSTAIVTTAIVGITASASGDNVILPSPGAGKQIFVYAWNLSFSGTCNAKFTDAISSKLLCGLIYGVANAGGGNSVSPNFLLSKPQPDLFHTTANSRLLINLSAGQAVGGNVSYWIQ